ncbi:uncharacterized protein LOC115428341 [Sphaeramia orbicularis]|uniref:uncharacterized protein LOC115428341 n=1 Tax=Sphaeramia orbicularis TaxID=375764 RepID=UPI0011815355|nr:uncharacterized protein LOC115428341 [Sphaeramia orbicularis]
MPSKSGAPPREEMLTIQVKNTKLHLNGQNLQLAAKNGRNSKTPGLHLSATHGKEAVGRLTALPPPTHHATTQLDLLHETPRPDPEREAVRRPVKLAPLELPEEVREAQKQKLKCGQQETKAVPCKPDVTPNEPRTRKQSRVKSAVCPSASTEPVKAQQPKRLSRPQLSHPTLTEQSGGRCLEDVVCQGTPAPLCIKPVPVSVFPQIKAQVGRGRAVTGLNPSSSPLQEGGRRRLRLTRAPCLQEDQSNSNPSTGGLSADEGRLAQGVQGRGQRAERAPRGHTQAGKGIKEPPTASGDYRCAGKSHQDDCGQRSVRGTLNRQAAGGGSSEHALEGVKPHASNWRLKGKKPLITNHNNVVALERLQL